MSKNHNILLIPSEMLYIEPNPPQRFHNIAQTIIPASIWIITVRQHLQCQETQYAHSEVRSHEDDVLGPGVTS